MEREAMEFDVDPTPNSGASRNGGKESLGPPQNRNDLAAGLNRQAAGDQDGSANMGAGSSTHSSGGSEKGCMTTMQRLQLVVTLLLVAVIGALAGLLAYK